MQFKKESVSKKREQFSSSGLKISLDKPIKTHKEKKSRKQIATTNNNSNHNEQNTSTRSINSNNDEKATELYQMLIQTLLKESKLKVCFINACLIYYSERNFFLLNFCEAKNLFFQNISLNKFFF